MLSGVLLGENTTSPSNSEGKKLLGMFSLLFLTPTRGLYPARPYPHHFPLLPKLPKISIIRNKKEKNIVTPYFQFLSKVSGRGCLIAKQYTG